MTDICLWVPPDFDRGWMLWNFAKPVVDNLRMWRGHLIRIAGFERLGSQGCAICWTFEPQERHWPGWYWRRFWKKFHYCEPREMPEELR